MHWFGAETSLRQQAFGTDANDGGGEDAPGAEFGGLFDPNFVYDDMAMRSRDEFRLVLIPFYGILAIFLTTSPVTVALWAWASPNVALLWVATTMGYVVAYEWLHLSYHVPADSPFTRRKFAVNGSHSRHDGSPAP